MLDEPFERIEDLAQYHLDAIKRNAAPWPLLPHRLFPGGLVTLEMAQRLTDCRRGSCIARDAGDLPALAISFS